MSAEITLRVVVRNPPAGVAFAMQIGRDALQPPKTSTSTKLVFETRAKIGTSATGTPRFGGAPVQGPAGARFLYINSGRRAGQSNSCWDRRAKIMLGAIDWTLIHSCEAKGGALETEFDGLAKDGGPACATVPLIGAWRLV